MDTAGAKRCSVYGHPRNTTPGLAKLAQDAMLYKYCFAPAPWTIPSHASLFSGLYASEHGCGVFNRDLPEATHNLPEVLQKMGYRTICITSNLLISQRGFDHVYGMHHLFNSNKFDDARKAISSYKKISKSDIDRLLFLIKYMIKNKYLSLPFVNILDKYYRNLFGAIKERSQYATQRTFALAKKFFKKHKNDKPILMFINCMETHWRYYPPKKYINPLSIEKNELKELLKLDPFDIYLKEIPENLLNQLPRLYEQELTYVSDTILNFYHFLEKAGLKDRSLFIVTSDHGESLGEHGLWGHIFGVFNEVIHIPLLIKYPQNLGLQGESEQLVQLHDLWATIMEIVGAPLPVPEASKSLLSQRRDLAFCEHFHDVGLRPLLRREPKFTPTDLMQPCRCVIGDDLLKLIEWQDGRLECYNLKDDYEERHNLMGSPAMAIPVSRLQEGLHRELGAFPAQKWGEHQEASTVSEV